VTEFCLIVCQTMFYLWMLSHTALNTREG